MNRKIKEKNDELLAEAGHSGGSDGQPAESLSQIHDRAYQIWLERGGYDQGRELEDWLQAEAEINAAIGAPEQDNLRGNKKPRYRQQAAG